MPDYKTTVAWATEDALDLETLQQAHQVELSAAMTEGFDAAVGHDEMLAAQRVIYGGWTVQQAHSQLVRDVAGRNLERRLFGLGQVRVPGLQAFEAVLSSVRPWYEQDPPQWVRQELRKASGKTSG